MGDIDLWTMLGSGGVLATVVWWYTLWSGRRRLVTRFLTETYEPKSEPTVEVKLQFEVTNIGERATALQPEVVVTSLTPKSEHCTFKLQIIEQDRRLEPHAPKTFHAKAVVGAVYPFCWYREYLFGVTAGSGGVILHRDASRERLGPLQFQIEWLLFHVLYWTFRKRK